jgi:hypothetical protein
MGVEVAVADGTLVITGRGDYTIDGFIRAVDAVLEAPTWEGRIPVLLDARDAAPLEVSTTQMQRVAEMFASHDDVVEPRRAHLVRPGGEERAKSRVASVVARVWFGHEVAVFDDEAEALAWLRDGATAG